MHCTKQVLNDMLWVGADDRRLTCFEGVYGVPNGVSYNSYLLLDEKTVLFDTVDKAVAHTFFDNVAYGLNGRKLDYLVIHHMEPDHAATIEDLIYRYPETKIICNDKIRTMLGQYFDYDMTGRIEVVKEGDSVSFGKHEFTFVMAPMVHWPEVMMSYDKTDKVLFTADAFGTFGALNGHIFADEVDFMHDCLDEARRYYSNIVGKYGPQVQMVLKKASALEINYVCPLHGFVWRSNIGDYIDKYVKWSTYTPEENGVMIAYASVYGNTENAAEVLACRLRDRGIRTVMYDVSVTPASDIVSAAFRYSHLVFASTTYNAGIFVTMEALLHDLVAHNIQNRTVAFMQNGSWAPTSGKLMREMIEPLKGMTVLDPVIDIRSSLKPAQEAEIDALVDTIAATFPQPAAVEVSSAESTLEPAAFFKLSYGLFVLTAREGEKDNGCIINTVTQITDSPKRISIAVNKANYTHDMILRTGEFNVSILTESVPFQVFQHYGFQSGRDTNKVTGTEARSANGLLYLPEHTNAFLSGHVIASEDWGTHTLFIAEVTDARVLSDEPSVTYSYYFAHIKPKPQPQQEKKRGWVCKICGYFYEGDELPADFVCPLCKHGPEDFERVE